MLETGIVVLYVNTIVKNNNKISLPQKQMIPDSIVYNGSFTVFSFFIQ